jgi:hypothetical protein
MRTPRHSLAVCLAFFCAWCIAGSASATKLSRTNLIEFQDAAGNVQPVKTVSNWQQRRTTILQAMQEVMGPLPGADKRCELDVRVEEETDCGKYTRRRLTYAAEPGSRVPAYLLVPASAVRGVEKLPAVLALHQTHALGHKVVVGLGNSPNDEYGVELALRGFVVLAPAYPRLANYQPDLPALGYQSGTMKAIWDNIRALDLISGLPYVRTNGFAAIGHSLGGHNGVFTAAFDERIKVVVSSCGLDSFQDYMDGNIKGWTSDRYMPRLRDYSLSAIPFDFPEILGAIAPRVCFLSAPMGDTNFKWRSVQRVANAARPIYELHGLPNNLRVEHPDCGHEFPRQQRQTAYELIERALAPR